MTLCWHAAEPAAFQDPYVDFSWMLRQRRQPPVGSDVYQPIFVRLVGADDPVSARKQRKRLRRLVETPADPLLMEPFELSVLRRRCHRRDPDAGLPDEYPVYRALGTPDDAFADLFEVLDDGTPVALDPSSVDFDSAEDLQPDSESLGKGRPIVAVIDDGIGFLNARFCKARRRGRGSVLRTRFEAIWLQALERAGPGDRSACLGEILERRQINALLRREGFNETGEYTALNARLARADARRSTDFGTSHGTHVLDLAAGSEPDDSDDPARGWPLLGVQLPPQAIADTSGTKFESYLVDAVRWVLRRAEAMDPHAPVIINLSLGMLAGPKDGTRFAEYQVAREARFWEQIKGQPVRVVWSFGNDYRKRLVAGLSFPAAEARRDTAQSIEWRVQPGDLTESYVEIRAAPGQPLEALEIGVTTPAGLASGVSALKPGEIRNLTQGDQAVARIYHVPEHRLDPETLQRNFYLLALAPTASLDLEPLVPSGAWQLAFRYDGCAALDLELQVQRDDSLVGYRAGARQSYFESAEGYGWDQEFFDYTQLGPDCAIKYAGSHSALATALTRQVFHVGAVRDDAQDDRLPPSDYCGEGAAWSVPGPTVSAIADRSFLRGGVQGCGTLSGSTRFLNGTSAAAGRLSRALALSSKGLVADATTPHLADFDTRRVSLCPVPEAARARLGSHVVKIAEAECTRLGNHVVTT
ncbi:S8 family serine peptidase [Salipiger bermudensis]|uniref:S8 family serine peptidase n=1 Tax=Salipiger bermudensis TaxID=344736 RepID=UPI001CD78B5C|nr:S8 family serine peptidase [Salipiger bermudensis]MCA0961265.1 S8 family serine peptidase [Salipiger bermudensis]